MSLNPHHRQGEIEGVTHPGAPQLRGYQDLRDPARIITRCKVYANVFSPNQALLMKAKLLRTFSKVPTSFPK
jgi:hypothetical protein